MLHEITITSYDPPVATVTRIHDDGTREPAEPLAFKADFSACSDYPEDAWLPLLDFRGYPIQAGDRFTVKYPEPYRSAFELPVITLVD
ncbi:hypothetical protein LLG88_13590 [bacterium]|nr:hypothetical protein [bacterium]